MSSPDSIPTPDGLDALQRAQWLLLAEEEGYDLSGFRTHDVYDNRADETSAPVTAPPRERIAVAAEFAADAVELRIGQTATRVPYFRNEGQHRPTGYAILYPDTIKAARRKATRQLLSHPDQGFPVEALLAVLDPAAVEAYGVTRLKQALGGWWQHKLLVGGVSLVALARAGRYRRVCANPRFDITVTSVGDDA